MHPLATPESTERVRQYWERRPCGIDENPFPEGTREYFEWIARLRYGRESFIEKYAQFHLFKDRDVLEVGIGVGTDAERFAKAGARFCGVELTERGVLLARRRFELNRLTGLICRANAEKLPFPEETFDFVYSWGVIHHSPDTAAAAREMYRVCKKGGKICCMVYHRNSLYAMQGWIVYGLLRGKPLRSVDDIARQHFESPGTQLFGENETTELFPHLEQRRISYELTPYDLRIARRVFLPSLLRRLLPRRCGYFLILEGYKP